MHRRALLSLPIALLAAAFPLHPAGAEAPVSAVASAQDRADVARVAAYLNSLRTLKARFLQLAPDGGTSTGTAWLERPGRMRFQYDPPTPLLLVAGHGEFIFYDRELKQTSHIPLGATPLGLLLAEDVTLSGGVTVTRIDRLPGQVQITLVRTASPGDGSLTLIFADAPMALRQWAVVDAQRQETRVSLFDVQLGGQFDQDMFSFVDPQFLPGSDRYYK